MNPTIIVMAHDRPEGLVRLLASVGRLDVDGAAADVVVSVDGGGRREREVLDVAEGWASPIGTVRVERHDHLGLVEHFRRCGDLTAELGPIVLLEDDLEVGPHALRFASAALAHHGDDPRVAAVCLSAPRRDGFRHQRFEPLGDGSDTCFARIMWFHGLAFTPQQWARHRGGADVDRSIPLPPAFSQLGDDEWFPDAVRAMCRDGSFAVLPRRAHAVNHGDPGVHFDRRTDGFQQPVEQGRWQGHRLAELDDPSAAVYDEYLEFDAERLAARVPELPDAPVQIDLRGLRELDPAVPWVVTSRAVRAARRSWGVRMQPLEQNLLSGVEGTDLQLAATSDVVLDAASARRSAEVVERHARHGRPLGRLDRLVRRARSVRQVVR